MNIITESEKKTVIGDLGIVWKDKLTTAEWLAEQADIIRTQYNTWIKLMPKSMKEGRLSDKQIRLLPVDEFLALVNSFLTKFGLASKFRFFEK